MLLGLEEDEKKFKDAMDAAGADMANVKAWLKIYSKTTYESTEKPRFSLSLNIYKDLYTKNIDNTFIMPRPIYALLKKILKKILSKINPGSNLSSAKSAMVQLL